MAADLNPATPAIDIAEAPSRRSLPGTAWLVGAGAALALLAICLLDPRLFSDGDTYTHVAAGGWILDHRHVPHVDVFSFTLAGAPWDADEWLSEVFMAVAYRLGGWAGVAALAGVAIAATALLLVRRLGRSLSGAPLALTAVLALCCVLPSLLARPHLLVLPLLVAWTDALLTARDKGRAPPWAIAVLMLLWANMHGSFVFGFVILGAFALEALSEADASARWRVVRSWGGVGVLSLVAATATPFGVQGLIFPFKLMAMASVPRIAEWLPVNFSAFGPFQAVLMVTLFVCLSRGVRVAPIRLLLLLLLLYMSLQHTRHVMLAVLVGSMLLAPALARSLGQAPVTPVDTGRRAWAAFAALAALLIGARLALPTTPADGPVTPGAALASVPAALRQAPVLNDYGYGGYLTLKGVRPFIDGRADMYGDAFLNRFTAIMRADPAALDRALHDYRIAWTILPPGQPTTALMDSKPGWRRLYTDRWAVVHVRTALPSTPPSSH